MFGPESWAAVDCVADGTPNSRGAMPLMAATYRSVVFATTLVVDHAYACKTSPNTAHNDTIQKWSRRRQLHEGCSLKACFLLDIQAQSIEPSRSRNMYAAAV